MDILSVNADQKLANVASSIGRHPSSWKDWFSVVVTINSHSENLQQEGLFWTKSIINAYLQDIEGRVYFCSSHGIHIICKSVSPDILTQTGQQICELVYSESSVTAHFNIYDLFTQGFEYAQLVLESASHMFSLPVLTPHSANSVQKSLRDPYGTEDNKLLVNSQGCAKVLLVEDDPVTRWMVRNALKHQCSFATADCGNKVFSMYSSFQPDVVFLDINLPDKNGYEILHWIMRNDPGARVVMFSSNDDLDNITSALDSGAKGFVAKPFLKEQLLHYIHAH